MNVKDLKWMEFKTMRQAIEHGFGKDKSFLYVIVDRKREALYIGKTTKGFQSRYRGGTHNALDAALKGTDKRVLIAEVDRLNLTESEQELIEELNPCKNVMGKQRVKMSSTRWGKGEMGAPRRHGSCKGCYTDKISSRG